MEEVAATEEHGHLTTSPYSTFPDGRRVMVYVLKQDHPQHEGCYPGTWHPASFVLDAAKDDMTARGTDSRCGRCAGSLYIEIGKDADGESLYVLQAHDLWKSHDNKPPYFWVGHWCTACVTTCTDIVFH